MKRHVYAMAVFMMVTVSKLGAQPNPVLLDVDPGIDDALAILLAVRSPELQVEGITVVAGNVDVDVGVRNTLQVLELAGRTDIPVARGAEAPLLGMLTTAEHVHGDNGLGNIQLPPPSTELYEGSAVDLIAAKVKEHSGDIILIPVGPLTNIAMALKLHPDLVTHIKQIVLMGGSTSGGNITAAAEFNIYNDPEAAEIVFKSGIPIVMVGLDVTLQTILTPQYLETGSVADDPVARLVKGLTDFQNARGDQGVFLHDPLAVGVAVDPSFVKTQPGYVEVETRGEKTRGETTFDRRTYGVGFETRGRKRIAVREDPPTPNAQVCLAVEADRFVKFFLERVAQGTGAR